MTTRSHIRAERQASRGRTTALDSPDVSRLKLACPCSCLRQNARSRIRRREAVPIDFRRFDRISPPVHAPRCAESKSLFGAHVRCLRHATATRGFRTISSGLCRVDRFSLIQCLLARSGSKTFLPPGSDFQQQPTGLRTPGKQSQQRKPSPSRTTFPRSHCDGLFNEPTDEELGSP